MGHYELFFFFFLKECSLFVPNLTITHITSSSSLSYWYIYCTSYSLVNTFSRTWSYLYSSSTKKSYTKTAKMLCSYLQMWSMEKNNGVLHPIIEIISENLSRIKKHWYRLLQIFQSDRESVLTIKLCSFWTTWSNIFQWNHPDHISLACLWEQYAECWKPYQP